MTTGWNGPAMRLLQLVFAARHQPLRTSAGACALGATQPWGEAGGEWGNTPPSVLESTARRGGLDTVLLHYAASTLDGDEQGSCSD